MCFGVGKLGCPTCSWMTPGVRPASLPISRMPEWCASAGRCARAGRAMRLIPRFILLTPPPAHDQDPDPERAKQGVDHRQPPREVARILRRLEPAEAEPLVVAVQLRTARQVEHLAVLAGDELAD